MVNTQKSDPFLELIKSKESEAKDKFKDALLFGHSEAHTDSGRAFVRSLQEQFDRKGFLTPKQVAALYQVDTERPYNSPDYSFDPSYEDDYDQSSLDFDPFDP